MAWGKLPSPEYLSTGVRGRGCSLVRGIGMLAYRLVHDVGHPGPMDAACQCRGATAAVSVMLGTAVGSLIPMWAAAGVTLLQRGRLAWPQTHGLRQCGMALRSSGAACNGEQKGK